VRLIAQVRTLVHDQGSGQLSTFTAYEIFHGVDRQVRRRVFWDLGQIDDQVCSQLQQEMLNACSLFRFVSGLGHIGPDHLAHRAG